ncbi:MAG: hypothetical protein FWF68_07860 [Spirochaetes bacterium]|nr:hypothetical protein [Brevinematales bacterium]MCL1959501.1 hypothetical protein [Spirochaetota bacterium]
MKNTLKLLGIIALIAVIGFSAVSCKDKDEEPSNKVVLSKGGTTSETNPFVATWSGTYQGTSFVITVPNNTDWSCTMGGDSFDHGTYTRDGNNATFVSTGGGAFGTATVSGNTLTVIVLN